MQEQVLLKNIYLQLGFLEKISSFKLTHCFEEKK